MGVLQVLTFVSAVVLVLENGSYKVDCAPSGTYSFTTVHRASSAHKAISPQVTRQRSAVAAAPTPSVSYRRSDLRDDDYRKYMPIEDTPEVKKAREQFFKLYQKQAKLAAQAEDKDLDGTHTQTHVKEGARYEDPDYYYYYEDMEEDDDDEDEYEFEDDDDEDEEEEDDEDEDEEDSDEEEDEDEDEDEDDEDDEDDEEEEDSEEEEDEEDSDEDEEEDSSSSEEDGEDSSSSSSSEEDGGEDSSSEEDGEDSSEEEWGEDSSSSSSSSSSSEEDDEEGHAFSWQSYRSNYQPLNTNTLVAPKAVTDTPEVKQAKREFFKLYKTQAELSFNAPDTR